MPRPFRLSFFLLVVLPGLFFLRCHKDVDVDNSDKNFPLTLRYTVTDDGVRFDWDAARVSRFEGYFLVRSATEIPAGVSPQFGTAQVIFSGDHPDSTEFMDLSPPLLEEVHYKLYVDIGDRFVESDDVTVEFDHLLFNGSPFVVRYLPDSSWVLIGDDFNGRVMIIDYDKKSLVNTRSPMPFASAENMAVTLGAYNGAPTLYWWSGYNQPLSFSLPGLATIKEYNSGSIAPFSWQVGKNDLFYTTQYDFDRGYATRSSTDFSIIKGIYRSNYYEHRTLALLDADAGLLLEASAYLLHTFFVDPDDGTVTEGNQKSTNSFQTFQQYIPVSHNGQFFIPQVDGVVYDRSLNWVAQIPIQNQVNLVDCCFSADDQYLYVLNFDLQLGPTITKFSFPGMAELGKRPLGTVQPRDIEATRDGGVVFVGANANNTNLMIIKKYNF